jgi:hypothetical protein
MTLAAFDGDALYQLVILALLGGGGLVKKFFEARQGGQDDSSQGSPYKFKTHRDEGPLRRSSGTRRSADRPLDPWVASIEEGGVPPETSAPQELVPEPILVQEPVDAAAATPEVSIEGGALEEFSLEGGSFDLGTASKEPWEPGGRIRESVFADIEQSVAHDITEHVDADMAGGVRGEAGVVNVPVHKRLRARRGWRDAVIVAEVLGSPVSMRGPASQPAGLRDE